jgi:hypothetical protein
MRLFGHSNWAHDPITSFKAVCKDMNDILANKEEAAKLFMDTQFSGTTVTAVVCAPYMYIYTLFVCFNMYKYIFTERVICDNKAGSS